MAQHSTISLKELKDETLISFHEDFTMHEMVYNECLKNGFTPNIAFKSSQWDFIGELVAANLGIALFPYSLCEKLDLEHVKVINLENAIPWEIALIVKKIAISLTLHRLLLIILKVQFNKAETKVV